MKIFVHFQSEKYVTMQQQTGHQERQTSSQISVRTVIEMVAKTKI